MWLIQKFTFLALFCLLSNPLFFLAADTNIRICELAQSCKGNMTDTELELSHCCPSCGCTDICKEKDMCCHDKEGRDDTDNVLHQECIPALYLPVVTNQGNVYVQSYYVRTKCPVTSRDDNMKAKCENSKPKTLQDIVFVSSEDGGIIYRNKFCALCHGEHNTINWQINAYYKLLLCSDISTEGNLTVSSTTDFILANCVLFFRRPNNVDPQNVMCFNEDIVTSKCNVTGDWDQYNYEIEKLCENPTAPIYFHGDTRIYKNVYCYICNRMAKNHITDDCQPMYERFPHSNTFEIINLLRWGMQDSNADSVCRSDQVFDTVFGQCKRLYCSKLSVPTNGMCIPFLEMDNSYLMMIRLVPIETVIKSKTLKEELIRRSSSIKHKLGFGACELCSGGLYINKTLESVQGEVRIRFGLKQAKGCTSEGLLSNLISIERNKTTIALTVDKRNVHFHVFWDRESSLVKFEDFSQFNGRRNCKTIYPEHGSYCPKIKLTQTEYKSVLNNHSNANDLLFISNIDNTNGTVFVCIDGYLSGTRSAGVQPYSAPMFQIVVLILLRLVV